MSQARLSFIPGLTMVSTFHSAEEVSLETGQAFSAP
jgi:hypothetical protein